MLWKGKDNIRLGSLEGQVMVGIVKVDAAGKFNYDYKYGRNAGEIQEYVEVVPFSSSNIPSETIDWFKSVITPTFELIKTFNASNCKLASYCLPYGWPEICAGCIIQRCEEQCDRYRNPGDGF